MNILIFDELLNGTISNQMQVELEGNIVTAEELIEKRVRSEVENYNNKLPEYFKGLIEPNDAEKTLNGFKLKKKQVVDAEKQVFVALTAFQKNGFFILVDDKQVEELHQTIELKTNSKISFLKLTPLVGG